MSRRTLINLMFFNLVFLLMLFWAFNNIVTVDRVEKPYTITGDFEQAAGVKATPRSPTSASTTDGSSSVERTTAASR